MTVVVAVLARRSNANKYVAVELTAQEVVAGIEVFIIEGV